jgi:hypothetical protein
MVVLGRCIKDIISCMCKYDIPNISDEESLRRPISSHSHVIIDYPYIVYVRLEKKINSGKERDMLLEVVYGEAIKRS